MKFETLAIHAGQERDAATGATDRSRSTRRRPSPRTRSGGIAASSTRAAAIPRAPRSNAASRRSRARASGSPTPPAWPRSPAPCSCCARAITWSSPTISTAVRTGSSRRSSPTSACASPTSTRPTRRRSKRRSSPRRAWSGSRARRIRCCASSTSPPAPRSRGGTAPGWSWTTPSRRRSCRTRSRSARTSWCTRRRSIWAATRT